MIEIDHLSWSSLKAFRKSPAHYLQYLRREVEPTDAMLLGSLIHCLILEPKTLNDKYYVMPKADRRTKEGKLVYEEALRAAGDKNVISEDLLSTAQNVATAFAREAKIQITNPEVKLEWTHHSGFKILSYVDAIEDNFFVELKSTKDADPKTFQRQAYYDGYIHQMALYNAGIREKFNMDLPGRLVAVETSAPYGVSVHHLEVELLHKVYQDVEAIISEFKEWYEEQPQVSYSAKSWNGIFTFDFKIL